MKIARIKVRSAVVLFAVAGVLIFQNCSETPQDTTAGANSDLSSNAGTSAETSTVLPFAYQANLDTVAYMSCDGADPSSADPNAYFTFRAGSYNNLTYGLGLTSAFQSATSGLTATARANNLSASADYQGAYLTLSLRLASNLNSTVSLLDWSAAGLAYDTFLPELDSPQIAGPLAAAPSGTYLNYFPAPSGKRLLEASIRLYDGSPNGQLLTNAQASLNNNSLLLVSGFTDPSQVTFLSPNDFSTSQTESNVIYGTGLQTTINGQGTLNSVNEIDLSQTAHSSLGSAFSCPASLRVMIVLQKDSQICPALTSSVYNPDPPVALQTPTLQIIRRVLRAPYWAIGISPINGLYCATPQPTLADACYPNGVQPNYNYANQTCVDSPSLTCPRFVSLCVRQ